jgi:hypothetical protein
MSNVRPPAVANAFYPGHPALLGSTVDQLLAAATMLMLRSPRR